MCCRGSQMPDHSVYLVGYSTSRSYWIPGAYVTSNSISAGSNALPRLRTLCTNSKNPDKGGVSLVRCPDVGAANSARVTRILPWYSHGLHTRHHHRHLERTRPARG